MKVSDPASAERIPPDTGASNIAGGPEPPTKNEVDNSYRKSDIHLVTAKKIK